MQALPPVFVSVISTLGPTAVLTLILIGIAVFVIALLVLIILLIR